MPQKVDPKDKKTADGYVNYVMNRHYSVVEEGSSWRGEVRESFVWEKELCLTWKDKLKSDWRTEDSFQQGKVTSCQPCLEKEESVARPHMGWRNGEASTVGCSAVDCTLRLPEESVGY